MSYVAKPFDQNFLESKEFETMEECKLFLDKFAKQKMKIDEWCMLGKIQSVLPDGKRQKIDVDEESFL